MQQLGNLSPAATADQSGQPLKRASPDARRWPAHYTDGDVEVSRSSVQRAEQFPPLNPRLCSLCPLVLQKQGDFRIAHRRRIPQVTSRRVVPFFFSGWQVSRCVVVRTPDK